MTRRHAAIFAAKAAVSVALIVILWRTVDVPASLAVITELKAHTLVAAVLMVAATTVITGARWWLVLRQMNRHVPARLAVGLMFVGNFFSQILPSSVGGDAFRVWYARQAGVPYRPAIGSVLLERASGLVGLALIVTVGVLYLGPRIEMPGLRIGLLAGLPFIVWGLGMMCIADRMRWLNRFKLLGIFKDIAADTRRVVLSRQMVWLVAVSVAGHLIAAAMVFMVAADLGVALSLPDALALVPPVLLITMFAISIAGWGVREGGMVVMLSYADVTAEVALAISVLFGVLLIVAALPGLVFWLTSRVRPAAEDLS